MDWGWWSILIILGAIFLIISVVYIAVYVIQSYRIDLQLVRAHELFEESPNEGYLKSVEIAEQNPKWVEPQIFACQLAGHSGRLAEAEDHGRKAIELLKEKAAKVTTCYHVEWKEDKDLSRKKYVQYLLIMVDDLQARAAVLTCYANHDYEGALRHCDDFKIDGRDYKVVCDAWRAHFCMLLGRYDEAEKHLENAKRMDVDGKQYFAIQGHWHLIHGDPKSAVEYYLKHGDRKSLAEDFVHIKAVFGIDEPRW